MSTASTFDQAVAFNCTQGSRPARMSFARLLRAYLTDAKYEALRMLRAPAFAIPFLVIPVPIYLLFGVVVAGEGIAKDPALGNILFIGFAVMAIMGPSLFGVGSTLAPERDAGLTKLKRALPQPAGSHLVAKFLMAMFFAMVATGLMITAAVLSGKTTFTPGNHATLAVMLVLGCLPFCAIGLAIGAYCSGGAAPGITNLVYLPMIYLGGLFIPLPGFMQKWVVVWPAFHLQQLVVAATGVEGYAFERPLNAAVVLVCTTVLFGALAIRRLARVG
jgi:ABC-2 type transport system permease protein